MKLNNQKGMALVMTLFIIVVMLSFSSIVVLRTVNEVNITKKDQNITKSLYLAEAGTQDSLNILDQLINTNLRDTINATNPSTVASATLNYVSAGSGIGLLTTYVAESGAPLLILNSGQMQAEYTSAATDYGSGEYLYNIYITDKSPPVAVAANTWDFPYNYRIESTGTSGEVTKKVFLSGDFTVRVQKDNFARYALFTNSQTMPGGTSVWFTDKTNFAGPIHTNGRFNIALNPSGTFEGIAEQHEQLARFYNGGWTVLLDDDHNGTSDVPTFNAGFNRGVDTITLASSVQMQDMIDQATGNQTYSTNGIFVPNDGSNTTGGIYVRGSSTVDLSVDGNDNAVYTVQAGGTTKIVTVDRTNNRTSVETVGVGTDVYTGLPDGSDDVGTIVFVEGEITDLSGTVQKDTNLTIASENNIVIEDDLVYSDYTPASGTPGSVGYVPPSAEGTNNLLGLVTWGGDVLIGNSAPDNVNVHATLLARSGILQVDDYNSYTYGPRGTATLMGGVITDNYGAFGLFSGSTGLQLTGYGRNFVYDTRMESGSAPPYFPTLNTFIAFTNDITDKMIWQEGGL